jgi:eukaryotic-like serine/threonine-protein kinase
MDPQHSTLIMPNRPRPRGARPPHRLAGRYVLGQAIGHGGMSTVFRARDELLDRDVAVKVLLPALAEGDPAHVARFEREARAAAALRHPAVVKIYDTGRDGETHFIVMECVAGTSLDRRLAAGRPLDPDEATRIADQVAEALAAAHAAGILHRDVKPANVMLTPEGEVKVLDFGIARAREDPTITQPTFAIGTAAYMAPERVLGQAGDERSDIYSLGCLLYAMLAGRPPFVAESTLSILHQQVHDEPVAPTVLGAAIAPPLEALVLRMLAKEPAERPQTASEVAGRLASRAPVPPLLSAPPAPRSRRPVAVLALMAVVALVLALAISSSGREPLVFRPPSRASARKAPIHHVTASPAPAVTQTAAAPATAGASQPAASHPVPPGHGGVPPGHEPGGPPGHKDKPPKPPKADKGSTAKKGPDGGD